MTADARAGPRIAVVDYGAGNLVSIGQGLRAVGADVVLARSPDALDGADGLDRARRRRRRPAMNRLRRRGLLEPIVEWARADRPYLGICLGPPTPVRGSGRGRRAHVRPAARAHGPARRTRRACRTSAGTRWSGAAARPRSAVRRHRRRRQLLLRALLRGPAAPGARADVVVAETTHGGDASSAPSAAATCSASSSIPSAAAATACGCSRTSWRSIGPTAPAARPSRARSRPDALPPRRALPRRRQRARRQGHPLRRSRRRGRSAGARRAVRRARAPTRSSSSTSPPRPRAAARSSTSSSAPPAARSCP